MFGSRRVVDGKPLQGGRIAVTRPADQAQGLIDGLRDPGAEPLHCPTIRIGDPSDPVPLQRALEKLALAEAREHTVDGLLQAVCEYYERSEVPD